MPQTKSKAKAEPKSESIDLVLQVSFKETKAEQQHLQMHRSLGITTELVSEKHRLYKLGLKSPAYLRVFNTMHELRECEQMVEDFADKLKMPVLMGLPLDAFGGSTFIPGTGPIPVYTIKAGSLFAGWGLGGHATMTRLAITIHAELQAKQQGEKTPYLNYLKAALDYKETVETEDDIKRLLNAAAEAPDVVGLPAALEAASGRGTAQGVLMFNPKSKLDTSTTIPNLSGKDWFIYDLGRAIASETSSSRRAHGLVHQSMVQSMDQDANLYVSYRVSEGVRKSLTTFKESLVKK